MKTQLIPTLHFKKVKVNRQKTLDQSLVNLGLRNDLKKAKEHSKN